MKTKKQKKAMAKNESLPQRYSNLCMEWGDGKAGRDRNKMIDYESANPEEPSVMLEFDGFLETLTHASGYLTGVQLAHKQALIFQLEMIEHSDLIDRWLRKEVGDDADGYSHLVDWYRRAHEYRLSLLEELKK